MSEKLHDAEWLAGVIDRFASAAAAQTERDRKAGAPAPVLAGLRTRGAHLAERVARRLKDRGSEDLPVAHLDVTLYRDDLGRHPVKVIYRGTELNESIDDRTVILIDDVLFTGRTIRAAMDLLMDFGRPARIRLYSVIDRQGARELPIAADEVGGRVETTRAGAVRVRVTEEDGKDEVVLES